MTDLSWAGGAPLERPVPYDLQAEESTLGALIMDRDAILHVEPILAAGDFYRETNGWIYAAICDLYHRREPPDTTTLSSELKRSGRLDAVGGLAYLAGLMHRVPTAVHVEYYARTVARCGALRRLISTGGQIAGLGYEEGLELDAVFDKAEALLLGVTQARRRVRDVTDYEALDAYLTGLEARRAGRASAVTGWATGLPRLDDLTGGCRPGKLWVITGESGGGKTTLQQGLALALKRAGAAVGFFSLEMDASELVERELAHQARVDSALLRAGDLTPAEYTRVQEAATVLLEQVPIRLVPGGGITLRDITAQAHRWQMDGGLHALVVDYFQLVRLPGRDKVSELDDLANGLKALAGDLHCTVITASQLSREAVDKDPKHWDNYMRGTGAIKQAADVVLTVAPQEERPADGTRPWRIKLGLTKQRGGPVGDVDALWWLAYNRIGEEDPYHEY